MYCIIFRSNKLCSYCSVISHNTDIKKKSTSEKQTLKSRQKVSNEKQWDIENDDGIWDRQWIWVFSCEHDV